LLPTLLKEKTVPRGAHIAALAVLSAVAAFSQTNPAPASTPPASGTSAIAVMQASIQKQKASIQAQAASVRQASKAPDKPLTADEFIAPMEGSADDFISPLVPPPPPKTPDCPPLPASDIDTLVNAAAQKHSLKPALLRAVMKQESGFLPCAVSVKGAQGLMQLMPDTAAQFQVSDPFDPKQNVDAGAAFLKQLLDKYKGDLSLALGAYNAGANSVDASGGVPNIEETKNYVASILADLGQTPTPKN
jgi:soluble lytic murein transglycosylase-like protein